MTELHKGKMRHIPLADIIVGERFREDFGNLEELVESIREKGVIQPISVSSDMRLLAGGRRYAACSRLELKTIPALIRDGVDDVDAREVELIENVHRKDFTWSEKARLVEAIDALYKAKDPNWSGRKTAGLIDRGVASVSRDLQLAAAISVVPELAAYKTADDAFKVLKKMEEQQITEELAKRQKARVEAPATAGRPDPEHNIKALLRRANDSYHVGDAFEGMAKMRTGGHVHFIECDPPYGIALNEQKGSKDSAGNNVDSYQEVPTDQYEGFLDKLTHELFRVANKDCWLVFWYGPTWHHQVITSLRKAGWLVDDIPAIWTKMVGQTLQPQIHLARTYEPFFVCRKGNPVLAKPGTGNVFNVIGVPHQQKYHPTERPLHLIRTILQTFTLPNNVVFVPFLGSGATLRGCFVEGMSGFGFDLNGEYKDKYLLTVEKEAREHLAYTSKREQTE